MQESAKSAVVVETVTEPTTTGVALSELLLIAQVAQARGYAAQAFDLRVATFQMRNGDKVVVDLEYGHATIGRASMPRLRRSSDNF